MFTDFQWGSLHLDQKSAYGQVADHLINGDSGKFIPGAANLLKTRLYGRYETSFRFLKFAFNLLSAAHCQIPRLLGRDIDRKADQTAWIALGISQERKTEVNGRCNMRSHVPSQKPVLRLSSRTEFS